MSACTEEMKRGLKPIPTAFGKVNQVVVIADQELWEGPLGDSLRFYYSSAYPILPQPEPIFDLKHFTPKDLLIDRLRKELRNYFILADLSDADSPTTKLIKNDLGEEKIRRAKEDSQYNSILGRDKWAKGQLIIYQFGFSREVLLENIVKNYPAIRKKIYEADRDKIEASVYLDGENIKVKREINEKMAVELRVPSGYFLALNNDDFVWIRKETKRLSSNIMIHKLKYTDKSQLTKAGVKAIRDSLGRKYIATELPNTYMQINDIDLPMLTSVKTLNNHYALEARGIWEIVNDFMGGAFICYLIHNADSGELLFIDGFVHAPGRDKRDFMMNLEYIISTVKF